MCVRVRVHLTRGLARARAPARALRRACACACIRQCMRALSSMCTPMLSRAHICEHVWLRNALHNTSQRTRTATLALDSPYASGMSDLLPAAPRFRSGHSESSGFPRTLERRPSLGFPAFPLSLSANRLSIAAPMQFTELTAPAATLGGARRGKQSRCGAAQTPCAASRARRRTCSEPGPPRGAASPAAALCVHTQLTCVLRPVTLPVRGAWLQGGVGRCHFGAPSVLCAGRHLHPGRQPQVPAAHSAALAADCVDSALLMCPPRPLTGCP